MTAFNHDLEAPPVVAPLEETSQDELPIAVTSADLYAGLFAGAHLADADLRQSVLTKASLPGASLRGARLNSVDLSYADLRGADLSGADLSGADFTGADLREANLTGADVTDAEFQWARLHGAVGVPNEVMLLPRQEGRVAGEVAHDGAPLAALQTFQRGQRAHGAGQLGLAERYMREVLSLDPTLAVAHYHLGCLALERGDVDSARRAWAAALEVDQGADRARLDLIATTEDPMVVADLLLPLVDRDDAVGAGSRAMRALADEGRWSDMRDELEALTPGSPALVWMHNKATAKKVMSDPPRPDASVAQLSDENWVSEEQSAIHDELQDRSLPAWRLHALIARAVSVGALNLAALAEQRLRRVAPEHRLWSWELKQLDVTAQAFEALVRTRSERLGEVRSIRWVALGAHGPTARVDCEGGVYFAKRWHGGVRPPASVAFTHRVSRQLANAGIAAPLPLADNIGDDVMMFAGDLLSLYPALPGRSIHEEQIRVDEAEWVGEALAKVHMAGQAGGTAYRPPGGLRAGSKLLRHPNPTALWEESMGASRKAALWWEHHPDRRAHDGALQAVHRRLRALARSCRVGICHGDFGAGNVLIENQQLSVLDLDLSDVDLWVWDLARTIDRLAVHWSLDRPTEVRGDVAVAVVRGYERVNPLNEPERLTLPIWVAASRVDLDASVMPLCVRLEPDSAEPLLSRSLRRLHRAAAGCPEIAAELCRVSR